MTEPIVTTKPELRKESADGMVLKLKGEIARTQTLLHHLKTKLEIAERLSSLPLLMRSEFADELATHHEDNEEKVLSDRPAELK